jgi:anti-sigma regulatory factor (Ser/Thr protein kinase)
VPLNRPALSLGSGPRGVQDARRWVVDTCRDIGRGDLVECAELGTSELVTNALLHAIPPLSIRVRGTREHPRVEVRDGSTELPVMPRHDPRHEDDLLLTFGRGLSIVARCSTAWGVDVEEDGKTVWFSPATRPSDVIVDGLITGDPTGGAEDERADDVRVEVRGVPLRAFVDFQRHYRELRREVRLLSLAHGSEYPLAEDLADLFGALERDLRQGLGARQIDEALSSGAPTADLSLSMPRETAAGTGRFIELLDRADEFARQQRLLSLARTPEQRRFQRWFLGEFVRQQSGEPPLAWEDAPVPPPADSRPAAFSDVTADGTPDPRSEGSLA